MTCISGGSFGEILQKAIELGVTMPAKKPSAKHIKKDIKEEKEIMHEAGEIKKAAKKMQKTDKAALKSVKGKK